MTPQSKKITLRHHANITEKNMDIKNKIHDHDAFEKFKKQYQHIWNTQDIDHLSIEKIVEMVIEYYENIIACMPGNVYWLDKNGTALGCNTNVLNMFGFKSMKEFKGLSFEEMGKIGDWPASAEKSFQKDTLEVIQSGKARLNIEEPPILHSNGQTIYFLTSRVPLLDRYRNIIGVVGISVDITELKKIEKKLREAKEAAEIANQAKTEFLENIRHDMRTPTSGIAGCANLIKEIIDHPLKKAQVKEYADNIVASSNTLLSLLNNILYTLKISSEKIPFQKKKFNLEEDLKKIISLNKAKADSKNLKLSLEYDKNLPPYLVGDNNRIFYIVLELVANALKFTDKGYVKVKALLGKEEANSVVVKISVEDSGLGIPLDKREEIFVQFKRLTSSYEGTYHGLGLGLSNIKKYIDDLAGEFYIESIPEFEGTIFIFSVQLTKALLNEQHGVSKPSLPHSYPECVLPSNPMPPVSFPIPPRPNSIPCLPPSSLFFPESYVLVVEDQPLAAKIAMNILEGLGCFVHIVPNGTLAVEYAKENAYDLILMDIGLPDINGNIATTRIRHWESLNGEKHIPIIALTAHIEIEDKEKCISAGMDAVLSKPFTKELAEDILNAFIPKHDQLSADTVSKEHHSNLFELPEETINYEQAIQLLGGNKRAFEEIIHILVSSLDEEVAHLQSAYRNHDWVTIRKIVGRLKGDASYCGAERFIAACTHLETYFKSGKKKLRKKLYDQILCEIENIQLKLC